MNKLQSPLAAVVQSSRRRFQRENHAKAIYHTAVIRRTEGLSVGLLLKPHELLVRFRFGLVSVCSLMCDKSTEVRRVQIRCLTSSHGRLDEIYL